MPPLLRLILPLVLTLLALPHALAQTFTGSYLVETPDGPIQLTLDQAADGSLLGAVEGLGERYPLDGVVDDQTPGVGYGTVDSPGETIYFEVYLEGDRVTLNLVGLGPDGQLDYDNALTATFTRQGSPPLQAAPAPAATPGANPLAPAASDPWAGSYQGDGLGVTLTPNGAGYAGELSFQGNVYPLQASAQGATLQGSFTAGGQSYPFRATLQGDAMTLETGGTSYPLTRQPVASANPLAAATDIRPPDPTSPVLVRGVYADLTEDNALAFLEALEFSLAQIGYVHTFTDADRAQLLQLMIQEYPLATMEEQLVLERARDIWNRVQSNWASSPLDDREVFVLGVLSFAFGEDEVQRHIGGGSSTSAVGGGGSCEQFEDCVSQFAPDAFQDMLAAQGCWASAGCTDYDSSTGSYTYEEYNPVYDSYDSYDTY